MNIEYYETKEKTILTKLFKNTNYLTGRFDINDLFIEYPDKIIIGEFKYRDFDSNRYNEFFMETDKYNSLTKLAEQQQKKTFILYINNFSDNKTIIWNITKLFNDSIPEISSIYMNKTSTDGFKNAYKKVKKSVYLLKKENGIIINK